MGGPGSGKPAGYGGGRTALKGTLETPDGRRIPYSKERLSKLKAPTAEEVVSLAKSLRTKPIQSDLDREAQRMAIEDLEHHAYKMKDEGVSFKELVKTDRVYANIYEKDLKKNPNDSFAKSVLQSERYKEMIYTLELKKKSSDTKKSSKKQDNENYAYYTDGHKTYKLRVPKGM